MGYGRIRIKFFVFVILIFIPILIFEMLNISDDRRQAIQSKLDSSLYLCKAISNSFEVYIDNLWTQEDIISKYILDHPDLTAEEISIYLKQVVNKQEIVQNLYYLDNEGMVVASSNHDMIGKSLRYREYVWKIREGEDKVLSDLAKDFIDDKPILPIARKMEYKGKPSGIMVASINLKKMGSIFSSLLFDKGDIFILVDRKGNIVYSNDSSDLYENKMRLYPNSPTWQALNGEVVKTEKKYYEGEYNQGEGYYILGCSYPIEKTGWALAVGSKYSDVIANVSQKTAETIMVFETMLIISIMISLLIGDYFITPIIKLKDAAYGIMNGDYSIRTNIKGTDEIAIAAQTFDIMAESIEKHDKHKSQFFINLSHELKTPLNVILASLQLVEKIHTTSEYCKNSSKFQDQLSLMKQNCYRLIRMVSNLIDLSKYDNGYLKLKLANYNIVSVVEDIAMSIVKYAETKKITILFDTDIEEKTITCDPDAIERIMLNLISNALKFTKEGGSIFVSIIDKNDKILISVKDTGIGIPTDRLESIFERFIQVDNSLNRNNEGSGIGLSLVKTLVEAHGGKITANSILGEGTEFIIEFPAMHEEDESNIHANIIEKNYDTIAERINLEFSDIYDFHNVSK